MANKPVSLTEQMQTVVQVMQLVETVYQQHIAEGKLTQAQVDEQKRRMRHVYVSLKMLRAGNLETLLSELRELPNDIADLKHQIAELLQDKQFLSDMLDERTKQVDNLKDRLSQLGEDANQEKIFSQIQE